MTGLKAGTLESHHPDTHRITSHRKRSSKVRCDDFLPSQHPLVTYRPLERSDGAAWYAYLAQPVVLQHTSWNLANANSLQSLFDSYESEDPESQIRFAVIAIGDDRLVGTFGFHTISLINKTAELAFDLCPSMWGKGIAQSFCQTAVQWAFDRLELVRVQAVVLEANARSARTLERSGFQREGYLRHYRQVRGYPGNFWMFSRTRCPVKDMAAYG